MRPLIDILLPVFLLIAVGWGAARLRIVEAGAIRSMSDLTFLLLSPALLFRSMAATEFGALQWAAPLAYFSATVLAFCVLAAWWRWRERAAGRSAELAISLAALRAFAAVFANTFMLGLPLVRLVYGEAGQAVLLTIIALHSLVLQSLATVVIEAGRALARADRGPTTALPALGQAARAAIVNPVTLPILLGIGWSLADLPLPAPIATTLEMLGGSAPSLCLVLLGASLAQFGIGQGLRGAFGLCVLKNLAMPVLAWLVARWVFGLQGLALGVVTLTAALPIGNTVYLFSQRYDCEQPTISVALLLSTLLGAATLPLALLALQ